MRALFPSLAALLGMSIAGMVPAQNGSGRLASDQAFVAYHQPSIAITHGTLIDGSGTAPARDMTVLFVAGRITAVGPSSSTHVPKEATVIDGTGKTVLPGFVLMHEHMFYPIGKGRYGTYPEQFTRLYLASGATTIRTAGSLDPYADLAVARAIGSGRRIGPDMDVTGPYIEGEGVPRLDRMPSVHGPDKVRELVNYWADEGVTSFKVYEHISRADLRAAIEAAHARGLKVTGHICSITYEEAIAAGIDNLEHSFMEPSDFVPGKKPEECPPWEVRMASLMALDPQGPEIQRLIKLLVDRKVALTSTLPVAEVLMRGHRPSEETLAPLSPGLRSSFDAMWTRLQPSQMVNIMTGFMPKLLQFERAFVAAGGLLMAGSDPTSYGGTVPGTTAQRQLHLMLEGGFQLPESIRIMSLNGAIYLGRDREIGSVAVGKRADLVLLNGDLPADANAIDRVASVFKNGVGYDPVAIKKTLAGTVGID
ncbi:amidohydrolase family protein [Peristeroidobacter soli]|uniref:amidohydrolase family protein n=1 Tax=Peristeroidobacter soli TaxID=2497877 RepID=UPI00101C5964|nr:amidohydrolase family protein [Peristeroidobacter soli]